MAIYVSFGVFTLVFALGPMEYSTLFCGLLILLSSIVHVFLYFFYEGYKRNEKGFYLVLGLIGVALGIIFMCNQKADIQTVCTVWGVFDIIRASVEIKESIPEIKKSKLEIIEIVISLGEIVLGILLCIEGNTLKSSRLNSCWIKVS